MTFLRNDKLFGPEDALFPKPEQQLVAGKFSFETLSRARYANAQKINQVVRTAFANVQMHPYTPYSFRKTLMHLMVELNLNVEQQKVWSQNLVHENFVTSVYANLPVSDQRQKVLIEGLLEIKQIGTASLLTASEMLELKALWI